ncbi:MAG: YceI family protein [Deltaproteobacteria bacterium]|nr:YceI family protein [Deltaproteobacteria bacterium]
MDKKKALPPLSDTARFSRIVEETAESDHWFLRRCFLPLFLSAAVIFIPVSSLIYATNPGESGSQERIGEVPVVLNIVPEKSEFECVACVAWFMCISLRMSATEGEFHTIPTNVNGNSKGFMTIHTDSLETISKQVAKKIKKTYLETEKYPEIAFSLNDLRGEGDTVLLPQKNRFKASGTLKLHGVEREIVFHPDIFLDGDVIKFNGETVVKLTDFNIKIPHFMFLKVKDEISIRFNVAWDYSPHIKNAPVEAVQ